MRPYLTVAIIGSLLSTSTVHSQLISVHFDHARLQTILDSMQNAHVCWFNGGNLDVQYDSISLRIDHATLDQCLKILFKDLPIKFKIDQPHQLYRDGRIRIPAGIL